MALKPIDQVFNRWLLDREFRDRMNENPEQALAGYDLSDTDRQKLSRLSRKVRRQAKAKQAVTKIVARKTTPPAATPYHRPPGDPISYSLN
ncbi:MAG: hypothetical protein Kow0031_37280 [Anaerolineae bacterium]